ncbi:MAG: carotenoid oxygenase family protein [Polyangiaceae bacterium]
MPTRIVRTHESRLPPNDDHPYRTGAWRPNLVEYDADDLDVVEGKLPDDLDGLYVRNTENPLMGAFERYHPFDGDGMLHAIWFERGRARYSNRLVPTVGLAEELAANAPLYAGIAEPPELSKRPGWGARGGMKDASSTDVLIHRGRVLSTFYQCGDAYAFDAKDLASLGRETWGGRFPSDTGISAHPKVDERTGELFYFRYGKAAPYLHYGVVSRDGEVVHEIPIALPGPRLPHDMAISEHHAILNDFPLFWDPALLAKNVHRPRYNPDIPSRFAVVPKRGSAAEVRWFEAAPTYVLHFSNAWEEGSEVILEGYAQTTPMPKPKPEHGAYAWLMSQIDMASLGARARRWRFDLATGKTREEDLSPTISEFPSIHGRYAGLRNRYVVSMSAKPGWFMFDGLIVTDKETGTEQRFQYPNGVYASESPVAPKRGRSAEGDAYVVTFVSDTVRDLSECHVFELTRIADGPIAKIRLPERIASGTHACFGTLD